MQTMVIAEEFKTNKTSQLILVFSEKLNESAAKMQCYEYDAKEKKWQRVGVLMPASVGRYGITLSKKEGDGRTLSKKEGDGRTPIGIFKIGSAFGFAKKMPCKLNYLTLESTNECIDDVTSRYYNQLVNSKNMLTIDWHSSEKMSRIPVYKFGCIIEYNKPRAIAGKGSCIFLHILKSKQGTAGCVAIEEEDLKRVLAWLDAEKEPKIAIMLADSAHHRLLAKQFPSLPIPF